MNVRIWFLCTDIYTLHSTADEALKSCSSTQFEHQDRNSSSRGLQNPDMPGNEVTLFLAPWGNPV